MTIVTDYDNELDFLASAEFRKILLGLAHEGNPWSWPFQLFQRAPGLLISPFVVSLHGWEKGERIIHSFIQLRCARLDLALLLFNSLTGEKPLDQMLLDDGHFDALNLLLGQDGAFNGDAVVSAFRAKWISRNKMVVTRDLAPRVAISKQVATAASLPNPEPNTAGASTPQRETQVENLTSQLPTPEVTTPAATQDVAVAQVTEPPTEPPAPPIAPPEIRTMAVRIAKRIVQASSPLGHSLRDDPEALMAKARTIILKWVVTKGIQLPDRAYEGKAFEIDLTRAQHPVSVEVGAGCWVMQFDTHAEDPPRRVWRVELVLSVIDKRAWIGISLTVIDPAGVDDVRHLSIPVFIRTLATSMGLWDGPHPLWASQIEVDTESQLDNLITLIESPSRSRPLIVVACHDDGSRIIDPGTLATALAGMAHVASLDCEASWALTRRYGKPLSVYGGAARVYRARFDANTDSPTRHPLFISERWQGLSSGLRDRIKELVLEDSTRTGADSDIVPSYTEVRRWIADHRIKEARRSVDTHTDQIMELAAEIDRMKAKVREADELIAMAAQDRDSALDQAADEQESARQLRQRVAWLEARVKTLASGQPESEPEFPSTWDDLESWVEQRLGGRVRLLPQAAKAARASVFKDITFVYRVLKMLGDEYQPMRALGGAEQRERCEAEKTALRVEICHVGEAARTHRTKDYYTVIWKGRRVTLDQHVSGSSSRKLTAGFRLYFHYDEDEGIVVIGHLPTHLPNTLS